MLERTALNVALWTFFFFVAIVIEEASLALWNGYSFTGGAQQIAVLPVIFALGMIAAGSMLPFTAEIASPRRQWLAALSLTFWATLLLVPLTRYLLVLMAAGLLFANWWHPIQSTAGIFWALLPLPAAAVGAAFVVQRERGKRAWTGPLAAVGSVFLLLLALSGRDNSLCLGEWDANFSPPPQSNPSAVHIVLLHLEENHKGSVGRGYVSYPEPPDSVPAKRYHSLFSGSVTWAQTGRSIRLYQQAAPVNPLVAEGTVSADAEIISLHFAHPAEVIVFKRYNKR